MHRDKINRFYTMAVSRDFKHMYMMLITITQRYIILSSRVIVFRCFSAALIHVESFISNETASPACTIKQVKLAAGITVTHQIIHPSVRLAVILVVCTVASRSSN